MMLKVVLLLAVLATAASQDGLRSKLQEVFEAIQQPKATPCKVTNIEIVTGSQSLCDSQPMDGFVPHGTYCSFWTRYVSKSSAICMDGFWFKDANDQSPFSGSRQKRFDLPWFFGKFNDLPDHPDVPIPPGVADTTQDTPIGGQNSSSDAEWKNCPMEPIKFTPAPGETSVYVDIPIPEFGSPDEWLIDEIPNGWLPLTKEIDDVTEFNDEVKEVSYTATNQQTKEIRTCTIKIEFEVKKCDFEELKFAANMSSGKINDCSTGYLGIKGEECGMSCDLGSHLSSPAVAECVVMDDDTTRWDWRSRENDTSVDAPFCEPITCDVSRLPNQTQYEHFELHCYDMNEDDYIPYLGQELYAGSSCIRYCTESGGRTCSSMAGVEIENVNDERSMFTCDSNGHWFSEEECTSERSLWKNCSTNVMPVHEGEMCCEGDWCFIFCNDGFYPEEYADFVCEMVNGTYVWTDGFGSQIDDFFFDNASCIATCGDLPDDIQEEIGDTVECFGLAVGQECTMECPEYHTLIGGATSLSCELNYTSGVSDWSMYGSDVPSCEFSACADLKAQKNGMVNCSTDYVSGEVICDIECMEGYTHHLSYDTLFTCDLSGTGMWTNQDEIPACVEGSAPVIELNLKATVATGEGGPGPLRKKRGVSEEDACGVLQAGFDVSMLASCITGCNCSYGELTQHIDINGNCVVLQKITLDCPSGMPLPSIVSRATSMFSVPLWKVLGLKMKTNPSISEFKENECPEGFHSSQLGPADPATCIKCYKGHVYNKNTSSCESCDSGKSIRNECVSIEDVVPDPELEFCDFPEWGDGLILNNCTDPNMTVGTTCKVHCLNPYEKFDPTLLAHSFFAHCQRDGSWEYQPEKPTCLGEQCMPGTASMSGMMPCYPCQRGTYAEWAGARQCDPCPADSTTQFENTMSMMDCVSIDDSISCMPGEYFDPDFYECIPCPMGTYCPEGTTEPLGCPGAQFTWNNGSTDVTDCSDGIAWTIEEEDDYLRTWTITGLKNASNFDKMQGWIQAFNPDIVLSFVLFPYTLEIDGDGFCKFEDRITREILYEDGNLFDPINTVGNQWLQFSIEKLGNSFLMQFGKQEGMASPVNGELTPIQKDLNYMEISVGLRQNASTFSVDDRPPYIAYLQFFTHLPSQGPPDQYYYNEEGMGPGEDMGSRFKRREPAIEPSQQNGPASETYPMYPDPIGNLGDPNSGDYVNDMEEKRDCFANLLNTNKDSDWPYNNKPVSCTPSLCPENNMKPDPWTCRPCGFGEFYSYTMYDCFPCMDWMVTGQRGRESANESQCVADSFNIQDYERTGDYTGPAVVIEGLYLEAFSSLSFYIHQPDFYGTEATVALAQYKLTILDGAFNLSIISDQLDQVLLTGEDMFNTSSGSGWIHCSISIDETFVLTFQYGRDEVKSRLLDLGLAPDVIEIQSGPVQMYFDVQRKAGGYVEDSAVYFAYPQLYEYGTNECASNAFYAQDSISPAGCQSCLSTSYVCSCPELCKERMCKDPMYIFEDYNLSFECPDGFEEESTCNVSCLSYYLHGSSMITCRNGVWDFLWEIGAPQCKLQMPAFEGCREPTLPDKVEILPIDQTNFTVACLDPTTHFPESYEISTVYTCDSISRQWEPSVTDIPNCYEPPTPVTVFPFEYIYSNYDGLSKEELHEMLSREFKSKAVRKNSPHGWDAYIDIERLDTEDQNIISRSKRNIAGATDNADVLVHARLVASMPDEELLMFLDSLLMVDEFHYILDALSGIMVLDVDGVTEVICPAGQNISSQGQCAKPCRENQVKDGMGQCHECDKDTSIIDENDECTLCPQDSVPKDGQNGTRVCAAKCEPGTFSKDGYKNANTGKCTKCKTGEYQGGSGQRECLKCPGMKKSLEPGSSECTFDYELELKNNDEEPLRINGLFNQNTQALSFGMMVKKAGLDIKVNVTIDGYSLELTKGKIVAREPDGQEPAELTFNKNDVSFRNHTPLFVSIGQSAVNIHLDGSLLGVVDLSNQFEIRSGAMLEMTGAAVVTNLYLSDRREINPMAFTTKAGVGGPSNLLRQDGVQLEEISSSQVKERKQTFQDSTVKDYCLSSPCVNGGTCSRGIGKANCTCQAGFAGLHCETEHIAVVPTWGQWTTTGPCSVSCGGGIQFQTRTCNGEGCEGPKNKSVTCNSQECKSCPPLTYNSTNVNANMTKTGSETQYTFSCPAGKRFPKINGTSQPDTIVYTCRDDIGNWAPKNITPRCASGNKVPKEMKKFIGYKFADASAVDQISCIEPAYSDFRASFKAKMTNHFACLNASSNKKSDVTVNVDKCSQARRKKRATGQDITLEFTLAIDDATAANLQAFIDDNVVDPSLVDVVQAIADLENTATEINSLSVVINGNTYAVDPGTITTTSSATCDTGYYADGTSCIACAAGTYYDAASNFCVYCAIGKYQNVDAQTECLSCDTGYTTSSVGSTSSSDCIVNASYVGPDTGGDNNDQKTVLAIALGVSFGALVIIGIGAAIGFKLYMASKAKKTASFPNESLVIPKGPEKNKLYHEIENPHFVPPPKTVQPVHAEPSFTRMAETRSVTPPGTVSPVTEVTE